MSVAAVQAGFPVFASDEWDAAHSIHRSRLDFPKPRQGSSSWCAGVNNQEQWIGVDLVTPKLVTTVETQGRGNHNQWVTAYSVSYSLDGINWEEADEGAVFAGNANKNGRVVTTFATPFQARTVRIHPVAWHGHVSMRFEVYFSDKSVDASDVDPNNSLRVAAVGSGAYITASSEWDQNHSVHRVGLDFIKQRQNSQSWCAAKNNGAQWVGVDIINPKLITAVETQGRGDSNQWVKSYKVKYSNDGITWTEADNGRVFDGNSDRNTKVLQTFNTPFTARAVRINPVAWQSHISMRFEVYYADDLSYSVPSPPTGGLLQTNQAAVVRAPVDLIAETGEAWVSPGTPSDASWETVMTVKNGSNRTLRVEWMNFQGEPVLYRTLEPYSEYVQYTWVGHIWRFIDDENQTNYGYLHSTAGNFTVEFNLAQALRPAPSADLVAAVESGFPLSASSEWAANHGVARARIDYPTPRVGSQSWCAAYNDKNQWIAVDLIEPQTVTAVQIQGRGNGHNQWVKKFTVQYSVDGINWESVNDGEEFKGSYDPHNKVLTRFTEPFRARTVRIHPTEWNGHISMRFEVFFRDNNPALTDGEMNVAAVATGYPTYSYDEWDMAHSIHRARLDYNQTRQGSQSWCGARNDQFQWVGVALGDPKLVTAVETQGRGNHGQWVTNFTVSYSVDGVNWEYADNGKVFSANANKNGRVITKFDSQFYARTVRINPIAWHSHVSMRFDVYFNAPAVQSISVTNLSLEVAAVASGSHVVASSEWDQNHSVHRVGLDSIRPRQNSQSWCAAANDAAQWIGVNVVDPKLFTSIELQGRDDKHKQWVKSYKVDYTNDGISWTLADNGRVFDGVSDSSTKVIQKFNEPFVARAVRIHPVTWKNHISVRMEAYFVDTTGVGEPVGLPGVVAPGLPSVEFIREGTEVIGFQNIYNGLWLAANNNGTSGTRTWNKSWEKFYFETRADGYVVLLSAEWDKYVQCNADKSMTFTDKSINEDKIFKRVDLGNDQFALQAACGCYVSFWGPDQVQCNGGFIGDEQTFNQDLPPYGDIPGPPLVGLAPEEFKREGDEKFGFLSVSQGLWLAANNNDSSGTRTWNRSWEKFYFDTNGHNKVALLSAQWDTYMRCNSNAGLFFKNKKINESTIFERIDLHDDQFALKHIATGKYVTMHGKDNMKCDGDEIGEKQTFIMDLKPYGDIPEIPEDPPVSLSPVEPSEPAVVILRIREHKQGYIPNFSGGNVLQAWYGNPSNHWDNNHGKDVTDVVRQRCNDNKEIKATNAHFGDPVHGVVKDLLVKLVGVNKFNLREHSKQALKIESGVIGIAYYGANGKSYEVSGKCAELRDSGKFIEAHNGNFGDPIVGTVKDLIVEFIPAVVGVPVPAPAPVAGGAPEVILRIREHKDGYQPNFSGADVVEAWYGNPGSHWDNSQGKDVTDVVRQRCNDNQQIKATNAHFGDPLRGVVKDLIIRLRGVYEFSLREHSKQAVQIVSGVIDTAFYGAKGKNNDASGKCAELRASGSFIEANNGNFGDPIVGTVKDLVIKFAPATGGAPVLPTPAPGIIFTPDEFERETERHIGFKCPSQGLWMAANNDGKCDTRTYNHAGTGSWEKFWFEAGDDNKVLCKSAMWDKYLQANEDGSMSFVDNQITADKVFIRITLDDGKFALKSSRGGIMTFHGPGNVRCDGTDIGDKQSFEMDWAPYDGMPIPELPVISPDEFEREQNRHIGFKCGAQGLWMAANQDGKCDTRTYNHAGTGSWEKFWFETGKDNKVLCKSAMWDKYLQAHEDGSLRFVSNEITAMCVFDRIDLGHDKFALKSVYGGIMTFHGPGNVRCDGTDIGPNQSFEIDWTPYEGMPVEQPEPEKPVFQFPLDDFEGWSEWTDSTARDQFNTSVMSSYPLMGMECRGNLCHGLRMFNNRPLDVQWNGDRFTSEQFSEEIVQNRGGLGLTTNAEGRCPEGFWMIGFSCQYSNCDDKRIHCAGTDDLNWQEGDEVLSPTFKTGDGGLFCPPDYYIIGMKCSGGWCDTQQLICRERVMEADAN